MSTSGIAHLAIDDSGVEWSVSRIEGTESMHSPFSFTVTCRALADDSELDRLQIRIMTSAAQLHWPFENGGERTVHAIVDEAEHFDRVFRLGLVARAATLASTVDHQVFLEQDAIAIATSVLEEHRYTIVSRCARTPAKRAMCVQAFESDLAFVGRILAEEGIVWFCDPNEADTIVLVDAPSGFTPLEGNPLPVREGAGLVSEASVYRARITRRVVSDKVTLRDHNFEAPSLDLTVATQEGEGRLERYEYRGHYPEPELGRTLAKIKLEEARATRRVLTGTTSSSRLSPGVVVKLDGEANQDATGEWLVIEIKHEILDSGAVAAERWYSAEFRAVPRDAPFRPARLEAPTLGGAQTMDVTGPSGEEIHTDKFGRIKAHFRWERRRPKNDTSSAWLRVTQPPTSGGFFLPRVGWEVLASFWGTSGDVPLEVGRLYTGTAPPPMGLPGKKIASAFGTQTTPGGGSANSLAFDDTAGNEGMSFTASRDHNERTENDKTTGVTADDIHVVGANRKLIVGEVHGVAVAGAQTYSIGASRTVNVNANKAISAGSESVSIGAARFFNVGGDQQTQCASLARVVGADKAQACIEQQSVLVTGASSVLIGGSLGQNAGLSAAMSVGAISSEEVGGPKTIKAAKYTLTVNGSLTEDYASRSIEAGGNVADKFATTGTYDIGGSATFDGSDVVVKADDKITLKADGITITITPSEITIDGKFDSSQKSKDKNDESYD